MDKQSRELFEKWAVDNYPHIKAMNIIRGNLTAFDAWQAATKQAEGKIEYLHAELAEYKEIPSAEITSILIRELNATNHDLQAEIEQLKNPWLKMDLDNYPKIGEKYALKVNGVTRESLYGFDQDDDGDFWFDCTQQFQDGFPIDPSHEWFHIPEPPKDNTGDSG